MCYLHALSHELRHVLRIRVRKGSPEREGRDIKPSLASDREPQCKVVALFGFEHCFFTVDRSTIPLDLKKKVDHEKVFEGESRYTFKVVIKNGMNKRISSAVFGVAGSGHGACVLRAARYMQPSLECCDFSNQAHGLCDAAFKPHFRLVPAYENPHQNLFFDTERSGLRIVSKHIIDVLKRRF